MRRGKTYKGRKRRKGKRKKAKCENREKEDGEKGILQGMGKREGLVREAWGDQRGKSSVVPTLGKSSISRSNCAASLPGLHNVNRRHRNSLKRVSLGS